VWGGSHAKSFLVKPEILSTYKAFFCSFMEYCSPLAQINTTVIKAFNIIGIACNEAESMGRSLFHHAQVGGLSVFYRHLSGLASSALSMLCLSTPSHTPMFLQVTHGPPSTLFW